MGEVRHVGDLGDGLEDAPGEELVDEASPALGARDHHPAQGDAPRQPGQSMLKSKQTAAEMLVLDIDIRLAQFLPNEEFCHYNMFNHHFFDSESLEIYKSKISRNYKSIIVITDPPFGGRPELISWTLQKIEKELKCELFHIFWIFPYFMEPKINTVMPSLHMSDYQVTYQGKKIGFYTTYFKRFRNLF